MNLLEQACFDIVTKNMEYTDQTLYLLFDIDSPLAKRLSEAFVKVMSEELGAKRSGNTDKIKIREFVNPPQPLYRGGLINPDNPHLKEQNRVTTSYNIEENKRVGLEHHEIFAAKMTENTNLEKALENPLTSIPQEGIETQSQEQTPLADPQIELIKEELINLEKGSIVILVQSTNFRLSTFRIRLELFHRGIHVVELNHLAYIQEGEFDTFINSLQYRTDEYVRMENIFRSLIEKNNQDGKNGGEKLNSPYHGTTRIESINRDILTFGPLERIRGNTGYYSQVENKGGTFPIGEVFTESVNLDEVSGSCLVDTFPNEDFSLAIVPPFRLEIRNGRVLPSPDFPPAFQKLYDWIVQYEGEVMVRELGFGLNPAISTTTPLSDINFYERKVGVHLSLGKKHGIYGKKLPKMEIQRFHIDVFIALEKVYIGDTTVFEKGKWRI